MRVLAAHNAYQQRGGEDVAFASEVSMLRQYGHDVITYEDSNGRISSGLVTGISGVWNQASYGRVRKVATLHKPDVAHFYNTFPLLSPSSYYAARSAGAAVVQKLANFRLICPGTFLLRDGKICESCIDENSLVPAIRHGCYRKSRLATAAVATMLTTHRALGTWQNIVDLYISPTEFVRQKFIAAGWRPESLAIKPHMIEDPGIGQGGSGHAVFVGRLSEEKGIGTLIEAWRSLPEVPLSIVGTGPLIDTDNKSNVRWVGQQDRSTTFEYLKNAEVAIIPSTNYEIGPLTVIEAFACGTPVIASDLGSMAERVRHNHTGLLFRPGDPADLAEKVRYAFSHPEHLAQMRINARREYEEKYTPERNYKMLIAIYEQAIENAQRRKRAAS